MPPPKRLVKPSRRHLLAGVARAQWDGLHPGPIAQRVKPNAVDAKGVRYELRAAPPAARVDAWVRMPSADQKRHRCLLCPNAKHDPKNEKCVALARATKTKRNVLYSFPGGEPLPGVWTRTRILVPPRYASGVCAFKWRAT